MGIKDPIFIFGISGRSGTNFLTGLLSLHADCERAAVREDCFVQFSDPLYRYADQLVNRWVADEKFKGRDVRAEILPYFGEALLGFISTEDNKRVVTKTPTPRNVYRCDAMFPEAKILFLVRDGRAVAESANLSWNHAYDRSFSEWNLGANIIHKYMKNHAHKKHNILVKYEDLVTNLNSEMTRILEFLELDTNKYDFEGANNLPVIGSSTFRGGRTDLHWGPVVKTDDFDPINRGKGWDGDLNRKFSIACKENMERLGYKI